MNCTRVMNAPRGGPSPIMPTDMAMKMCLASSPPLCSFLGHYDNHLPCLSPGNFGNTFSSSITTATMASSLATTECRNSSSPTKLRRRKKKSVVFADTRGLALTAVHVFSEADDDLLTELQFHLTEMEGTTAGLWLRDSKDSADCVSGLVLDFTQPSADYLDLRNRLKSQQVCLETCFVQEGLLSGTVQVRNICFEKSVSVRITFDSWLSFQDVQCQYLNHVYGCPDTDTFSFSISVPQVLDPSNRVEFCIQYQTREETFWDNNLGDNYRLVVADPNSCRSCKSTAGVKIRRDCCREKRDEMEFDPFGSPRTAGIFPEWQSWGHVETSTPYW